MEAYKPYLDYLTAGKVCETAYILSHEGAVCTTNLPIKNLPAYNFQLEDQNGVKSNIVVDERVILLQTLNNNGVPKSKSGIRLYNQKYFSVRYDANSKTLYLKKEGGGACIVKTNKFIIIGTFNSALKMENGVPQNPGELNKRVEGLAHTFLKSNN